MPLATSVYRALLLCYPAAFRQEYGSQMLLMFAEQLGEARRKGRALEPAVLWMRAASDTLTIAPKEHCHVILQDLRYAMRAMRAKPGFAAVAILSLALGIGANSAIFSLWNGVLHSSLPGVRKPEQLVILTNPDDTGMWSGRWIGRTDGPRSWLTWGEFEQLRDKARSFSGLMASQSSLNHLQVRIDGGPQEEIRDRMVSGGFFDVLGITPAVGRLFTPAHDRAEFFDAVISYHYWQRRFGGRADVVGKSLALSKAVVTIIGVAPRGFVGETSGQQPDLWLPLRLQPVLSPEKDRLHDTPPEKSMWLHVFARLRPGTTPARAESEVNAIFQAGLEAFYGAFASGDRRREFLDQQLRLRPAAGGASKTRHEFAGSLTAVLAGVGVLLLIACANLANLMLARGAVRKPEIALRLSLGASRGRIVRQLVTESLVLAGFGGATGLAAAWLLHGWLERLVAGADRDFAMSFSLDPVVLSFALAATLASALLFGALPAWQVTRAGAGATLKEQTRSATASRTHVRFGRALVSLQLALSLPLLIGAGLLVRTLHNLRNADLGFVTDRLLLARVDLRDVATGSVRLDTLVRQLIGEIQRIPGVRAASFSHLAVFSGGESSNEIEVPGYVSKGAGDASSGVDAVGPNYFSTLGIPIIIGRDILEMDRTGAPAVCVINEALARRFFAGRNPLGMTITSVGDDARRASWQVIGVARNAQTQKLRDNIGPRYFVPYSQEAAADPSPTFLIRLAGRTAPVTDAVRRATEHVNAGLPVSIESMEERMTPLIAQDRATAQLAMAFGCVALALAAIGLYGVLSYGVARRSGEIALRMALGARPEGVIAMILRETLALVAGGMALGSGLAYAASELIQKRLYGVAPQDPLTLCAAIVLLLAVALSAAYLPARRASRLDPMAALRQE